MSSLHVAYKMFILVSACIISFILISFFYRTEDNDLHTEVNANYTYVHIKTITLCIISRTYQIQVNLRQIYVLELSLLYNPTTFWEKKKFRAYLFFRVEQRQRVCIRYRFITDKSQIQSLKAFCIIWQLRYVLKKYSDSRHKSLI